MTEAEWNECTDPQRLLEFLRGKVSDRKLQMFAVACCRRLGPTLDHDQETFEVAEQRADGLLTPEAFLDAWWDACEAHDEAKRLRDLRNTVFGAALGVVWSDATVDDLTDGAAGICGAARMSTEKTLLVEILRDLIGPSTFRAGALDPAWLTTPVTALAESIYNERAFDRLPLLADALEEAGCTCQEILAHCREPRPHARGCWVVDLLLAKEKSPMTEQEWQLVLLDADALLATYRARSATVSSGCSQLLRAEPSGIGSTMSAAAAA